MHWLVSMPQTHLSRMWVLNPILTGGGGVNLTPPPPCTKSATTSWLPQIATRLFMSFFFQVLRIFWYQVWENRTIGREVTWHFVLARDLKGGGGVKLTPPSKTLLSKSPVKIGLSIMHLNTYSIVLLRATQERITTGLSELTQVLLKN